MIIELLVAGKLLLSSERLSEQRGMRRALEREAAYERELEELGSRRMLWLSLWCVLLWPIWIVLWAVIWSPSYPGWGYWLWWLSLFVGMALIYGTVREWLLMGK